MGASNQMIRLRCGTTNNEWGKRGIQSLAHKYARATTPEHFSLLDDQPYGELWMGTHPSLPSQDFATHGSLLEIVKKNPQLLSGGILRRFGNVVPYLFKVLSIEKALSIQTHPDQGLARKLHARDREIYPDENHKPEMVIALTRFEALCGFRPVIELSDILSQIHPLQELVGNEAAHDIHLARKQAEVGEEDTVQTERAIQIAFEAVIRTDSEKVKTSAWQLMSFAKEYIETEARCTGCITPDLARLIIRLYAQHPNDIGLFIMLFMNIVQLDTGEALFLQPGELHAYLSGGCTSFPSTSTDEDIRASRYGADLDHADIMECMASSANVIRAGFTHKLKDLDGLLASVSYNQRPPRKILPMPDHDIEIYDPESPASSSSVLYDPAVEEFVVARICLNQKGGRSVYENVLGPNIFICTQGRGIISANGKFEDIALGYVYFVGDGAITSLESTSDEVFVAYRAFCNIRE